MLCHWAIEASANQVKICKRFEPWAISRRHKIDSQPAGFEPARGNPIGFQVQRLNHSATTATHYIPCFLLKLVGVTKLSSQKLCSRWGSNSQPRHVSCTVYKYRALTDCATGAWCHSKPANRRKTSAILDIWRQKYVKWRCRGSNPGPHTCKACALPLSYIPCYSSSSTSSDCSKCHREHREKVGGKIISARCGVRTHAILRLWELKSHALDHSANLAVG